MRPDEKNAKESTIVHLRGEYDTFDLTNNFMIGNSESGSHEDLNA
jgi:hypothetical protein